MSGAPLTRLSHVQREVDAHVNELNHLEDKLGIKVHWFGLNPWQDTSQIRRMPKVGTKS